jgi:ABC-type polysaccharide/polyol phosphate transport system ATPase subunit
MMLEEQRTEQTPELREPAVRVENATLRRRTQEEFSYDLKRSIFAMLEGRYKTPKSKTVLQNINMKIMPGEKVGIIGENGSGKSTLLRLICGILRPSEGRVHVRGSIAPLIELGAGFDPDLSVYDNIVLYGILLGFSKDVMHAKVPGILAFSELGDYAAMPVKTLSSGMHARLGFAIASDVDPDVLVLDEVLSIGDEHFRHKCKVRLERFWHKDVTVFLVSHDLGLIETSCERVICLQRGRIAFDGAPRSAIRFYLDTVDEADRLSGVE